MSRYGCYGGTLLAIFRLEHVWGECSWMAQQSRRFTFTLFDEAPPEYREDVLSFMMCGQETCPETGRLHWQGYLETSSRRTLLGLKRLLGLDHIHLEHARGDFESNLEYCSKSCGMEALLQWGEPMRQGSRADLNEAAAAIVEGSSSVAEIATDTPAVFHQYGRTLLFLENLRIQGRQRETFSEPPMVRWYWGRTGSGKTHSAWTEALTSGLPVYCHTTMDKGWWDLYTGETKMIIDDFRGQIPFCELLRILDRYPVRVPRRGRDPIALLVDEVWITSHKHPREVYKDEAVREDIDQLLRRITVLTEFN